MKRMTMALGLGLMTTWTLLWLLAGLPQAARAASFMVCPGGPPACDYATIQAAVDAASDGDVIKVVSGVYSGVQQRNDFTQVVYINKSITIQGGYTLTNQAVPDPAVYPVTLDAQGQGRVIYAEAPAPGANISLTIEGLRLIGGEMHSPYENDYSSTYSGGGMYVTSATLVLRNSQVSGNIARSGGGLYVRSSVAEFSGNTISDNDVDYVGGGLYITESIATFNYNVVSSNFAFAVGGLYQSGGEAMFNGNTFSSNYAIFGCGGLFLIEGDFMFSNNIISSNFSPEDSGGLCLYHNNSALKDNVIISNWGVFGGGFNIVNSNVTLDSNSILSNGTPEIFGGNGGGLFIWKSVVTLTANTISFNESGCCAGGGLSAHGSTLVLVGNTVLSNTAYWGGGMYIGAGTSLDLVHNTIAHNASIGLAACGDGGSGIYVSSFTNTIALTNNIIISHQVGITVAAGSTATLQGTLWGNARDWGGAGIIITGTHNVWGDPDFVNPAAGDYHIGPGSAARDAGVDAGVSNDMDGDQRPQGLGFDLGADELRVALEVSKQAQPAQARAGKPLTYTLRLANTGQATLHATVSDTLPVHITPGGTLVLPSGTLSSALISPGGLLTWTDITLAPGEVWTAQFAVTVAPSYTGPLTNVLQATSPEGAMGGYTLVSPVALEWHFCYLPLVLKSP